MAQSALHAALPLLPLATRLRFFLPRLLLLRRGLILFLFYPPPFSVTFSLSDSLRDRLFIKYMSSVPLHLHDHNYTLSGSVVVHSFPYTSLADTITLTSDLKPWFFSLVDFDYENY